MVRFDLDDLNDVTNASEAEEAIESEEDEVDIREPSDGEDLFGENMNDDYAPNPELDRYDPEMIDDETNHTTNDDAIATERARMRAEAEMRARDRAERGTEDTGRVGGAQRYYRGLHEMLEEGDDAEDNADLPVQRVRRRRLRRELRDQLGSSVPSASTVKRVLDEMPFYDSEYPW